MPAYKVPIMSFLDDEVGIPDQDVGPDNQFDGIEDGRVVHQLIGQNKNQVGLDLEVDAAVSGFGRFQPALEGHRIFRRHDVNRKDEPIRLVAGNEKLTLQRRHRSCSDDRVRPSRHSAYMTPKVL